MPFTRSPIICILGHVDHGKTTLLDSIRGTSVAKKEAGGITQMIGASYVTKSDIDALAKDLASKMKADLKIPGLLFIDTPGHEAFTNLRDRGGSLADLAILIVDIMQGFQPQTVESIKILKQYKTPFIIAANKIDSIDGWKSHNTNSFLQSLAKQPDYIRERLDQKMYDLMGKISEHGFDSERFDKVQDFSKTIAIVPVSAKTKEGLSELLVLIGGLSQKFLGDRLEIDEKGRGKGSIVEVKDEKGLGTTLDIIIYDGILRKNDEIAFMTSDGIKRTKVRGLLEPNLGSGKDKFTFIDSVVAAAGVKVYAPDLDGAIPGSPIEVIEDFEQDCKGIEAQFKSVIFQKKDEAGAVLRADSLGSVEALLQLLKDAEIPVRDASVGTITRKEVISASVVAQQEPYLGVVMGFNVKILDEAWEESKSTGVPIIYSDIIYRLVDDYNEWLKTEKEKMKRKALDNFVWPGKIKVLEGYVFRVSKPAIFGVDILGGKIKKGYRLMNEGGEVVGEIREIQREKEKVEEANPGEQLAISCDGINLGKNVNAGDVLYTYMTVDDMKAWEEHSSILTGPEKELYQLIRGKLRKYF
jgi:translation initiation factor 5B